MRLCLCAFGAVVVACALAGCITRWKGQDLLSVDPDFDAWIHHPQTGTTNVPGS